MIQVEENLRAQREELFQSLQRSFAVAEACAGACLWDGQIADRRICLRAAGSDLLNRIVPAMQHLTAEASEPDLTVCAWDSRSSRTPLPLVLQGFFQLVASHHWEWLDSRHELRGFNDERFRCVYRLGPTNILSFWDRQTATGLYWMEDAAALPYWELGSPLQTLLNWWASDQGLQYVHAAAVGNANGALLLTGPGGSGKSTTALTCLEAGLGYLGDDYCLVSDREVFSLYATAKLVGEADFQRFPELRGWIENCERAAGHKALLNLALHRRERLVLRAPLRAVVVLKLCGGLDSRVRQVKGAEALLALAPTTVFQLPGTEQLGMSRMTRVLRSTPCFVLELGSDIRQIPGLLEPLLAP